MPKSKILHGFQLHPFKVWQQLEEQNTTHEGAYRRIESEAKDD